MRLPLVWESAGPPVWIGTCAVVLCRVFRWHRLVDHRNWHGPTIALWLYRKGKVRRGGYGGHYAASEWDNVSVGDIKKCILRDTMLLY